jgi:hypothetical protein
MFFENQKSNDLLKFSDFLDLAVGFIFLSGFFFFLGVCLLFNKMFILLGNISFLTGLILIVGIENTIKFFMKRGKRNGSAFYFGGLIIIIF